MCAVDGEIEGGVRGVLVLGSLRVSQVLSGRGKRSIFNCYCQHGTYGSGACTKISHLFGILVFSLSRSLPLPLVENRRWGGGGVFRHLRYKGEWGQGVKTALKSSFSYQVLFSSLSVAHTIPPKQHVLTRVHSSTQSSFTPTSIHPHLSKMKNLSFSIKRPNKYYLHSIPRDRILFRATGLAICFQISFLRELYFLRLWTKL